MDITDFLAHDRKKEFLVGYYKNNESAPEAYFEYGIESDKTTAYNMLIKNVMSARSNMIIHTTWDMGWDTLGFVELQDGTDWQVVDYTTRLTKHNPNVLRIMKSNPATEYVLSLVAIDNPMKIFQRECKVYKAVVPNPNRFLVYINGTPLQKDFAYLKNNDKVRIIYYAPKVIVNGKEYTTGDITITDSDIRLSPSAGAETSQKLLDITFKQTQ